MDLITTLEEMTSKLDRIGRESVGLIITKGALHEGHASLIKTARQENKYVIVCTFLHPKEFVSEEAYQLYPRKPEEDRQLANRSGADFFFCPPFHELYPKGCASYITIDSPLMFSMNGKIHPKYYMSILTTYHILLYKIRPSRIYLCEKDIQKRTLLGQMIRDFHEACQIRICPVYREEDGLILSSKNVFLKLDERRQATSLHRILEKAKAAYKKGTISAYKLKLLIESELKRYYLITSEYIEVVETNRLSSIETITEPAYILLAARVGCVRLTDYILLGND